MSDPVPAPAITAPSSPAAAPAPAPAPLSESQAAAVVNAPKSGFISSELWLKLVAFAALLWLANLGQDVLPQLAALPSFPAWLLPLMALVPKALAGVAIPWLSAKYLTARTSLKLGLSPPANDNDAAGLVNLVVNKAAAILLVLALVGWSSTSWAQTPAEAVSAGSSCVELLDAGVPAPAIKLPAGAVLEQPSWVVSPARMCAVGQALQACEVSSAAPPSLVAWVIGTAAVGLVAGAAAGIGIASATGHLK